MRRVLISLLVGSFFFVFGAKAVTTSAQSAILMDAASGRVLYTQDADTPRPIASITKLMTALICAECYESLEETVLIAPDAVGIEGSSLYLKPMEEYTVRELLYGLLLRSGNDAAAALAIDCAGDMDAFVAAMNYKARTLGMTHTHFTNPHGLEDEEHYSSARDMAILALEVLKNEALAEICAAKSYVLKGQTIVNHNKLLSRYDGCIGFKTGYTTAAGRTLVSGARREEGTLIAVTLDDGDDWADHAALLDYGFAHYQLYPLCRAGKTLYALPVEGSLVPYVLVTAQEDLSVMLTAEEAVTCRIRLPEQISAPVKADDILGSITFYAGGENVGKTYLVAASAAEANQKNSRLTPRFLAGARLSPAQLPVWRGMLTRQRAG